jgi:hypothetical protein
MTTVKYTVAWRPYLDRGRWWVEESVGVGGSNKVLYGPIPTLEVARALIEERRNQVQDTLLSQIKSFEERFKKPKVVLS